MVSFEIRELNEDVAVYSYYPENDRNDVGILRFFIKTGDWEIDEPASFGGVKYPAHLARRLNEFRETGNWKESGYVAWG